MTASWLWLPLGLSCREQQLAWIFGWLVELKTVFVPDPNGLGSFIATELRCSLVVRSYPRFVSWYRFPGDWSTWPCLLSCCSGQEGLCCSPRAAGLRAGRHSPGVVLCWGAPAPLLLLFHLFAVRCLPQALLHAPRFSAVAVMGASGAVSVVRFEPSAAKERFPTSGP